MIYNSLQFTKDAIAKKDNTTYNISPNNSIKSSPHLLYKNDGAFRRGCREELLQHQQFFYQKK